MPKNTKFFLMQFPLSKMVMKACKGKLGQDVGTTIKKGNRRKLKIQWKWMSIILVLMSAKEQSTEGQR